MLLTITCNFTKFEHNYTYTTTNKIKAGLFMT